MADQISSEITTEGQKNVTFKVQGREDGQGYLSPISVDSKYGLVLLQEWWGLNRSICKTSDAFATYGFRVLCPDIYRGKVGKDRETAGHLMSGLDWAGAVQDIGGAVQYLRDQGCTKVGVLGFCMGGALTITSACNVKGIDATAPFYGVPDLSKLNFKNVEGPMICYIGELDAAKGFSTPDDGERLRKAAVEAGVNFELNIVQGANHAFMNIDSQNHHPEAYKRIIKECTDWFRTQFEK